ncbi:unnamed protein product [Arabidopsis thaliana]|uniref:Dihydrolipoamide acetyltransferase component of pyruvate dehydrogenase complex n=1 Tax=Arabidopsis thaliana TaxID=3702 RepID=A0A7G2DV84_ARATH|nr:unnamed protein product [Arabidopsis thaliana]
MSRLLQTPFLPSVSLPTKTRSSVTGFRVKPRIIPIQAKIREIFMPALSSTMTEGKIVSWVKSEGDKLNKGESVVVVESDKADMDVETFYDGYLAAIMVEEGGVAPVGSAIALLAETEDEIADAKAKASGGGGGGDSKAPPASPPTAAVEAPVSVEKKVAAAPVSIKAVAASAVHPASEGGKRIVASPYAKKLAKELKVELAGLVGSGPMGRIVAKDVEAVAAGGGVQAAVAVKEVVAAPGVELGSVVPFTTMQGAVSRNMVESLGVPTFRVGYTISTDALDALYKKIKSKGVTMTALLAKATALALAKHPVVNSSCRDGNSFVTLIRLTFIRYLENGKNWLIRLEPSSCSLRSTFTLSNLGMFGVDRFDAILPPGTGAIMAVGASQPSVVATKDGRIGMKNQMQVNVTADHRVIYGADLAQFLQTLASIIEDPKDLTF